MRSKLAFQFSVNGFKTQKMVYLWTFTFAQCEALSDARKLWTVACKEMVRQLKFCGLRVFELHPGGHGLHVHVVTDRRFDVTKIRPLVQRFRFGRVHVKMIPRSKAGYVGKYLSKQRPPAMKGVRLWQSVGGQEAHRVKDIVVDTPFTRAYYHLKEVFPWWERVSYHIRSTLTLCFAEGDMRRFSYMLPTMTHARI